MDIAGGNQYAPPYDLRIDLYAESQIYSYRVYGSCLKAASPVWRKFLEVNDMYRPPLTLDEGDGRTVTVLTMDDVKPTVVEIVFNVLHHRTERINRKIDFATIYTIAKFVHEYDCKGPFVLWAENWIEDLASDTRYKNNLGWILLGRVFPKTSKFKVAMNETVRSWIRRIHEIDLKEQYILVKPVGSASSNKVRVEHIPATILGILLILSCIASQNLKHDRFIWITLSVA